jgi:16S rRNA (cytosine967-C5)-methyltransferase
VLDRAASLAKPGGRIVYVTCSVLPEENDDAVGGFVQRRSGFEVMPARGLLARASLSHLADAARLTEHGLQMTPRLTGTDGFYVAALRRAS